MSAGTESNKQSPLPNPLWTHAATQIRHCEAEPKGLKISVSEPRREHPHESILPWRWLRDNCRCAQCINQDTLQRQVKTFEISPDINATNVKKNDNDGTIQITWNTGHASTYPCDFIAHYGSATDQTRQGPERPAPKRRYWGRDGPQGAATVEFADVMASDEGVRAMLDHIVTYGLVFVENTPRENAEATQKLLERIAFIRETHYGGFYDFIPDLAMADTAYTNLALAAHTDTTYFTDPAGLQAFHMLSHEPAPGEDKAEGGASLLVDGFRAARKMRGRHHELHQRLVQTRLPWHASGNKGISTTPDKLYPVIEQDPLGAEPHRIRWNNDDRGVVPMESADKVTEWYKAAEAWNEILTSKDSEYWVQLKPGTTLSG
ncbi:hypothetical protein OQA88_4881 [Cercophora sp. LCS_1]